ncbi:MAG: ERCC4 domain-containing protein [Candidatus Moranbacteria bacterium]|nr:ERCC4 domain-containing protein [Candidatus Moranbacteria bacterium]
MDKQTIWTIRKTDNPKFPYRLTIKSSNETLLDLYTQDKWPGTKGNIFCLRALSGVVPEEEGEEVESVSVWKYGVYGKRATVILDRPRQKRCSFLFLTRAYKQKEGEYEQIFWQTQQGLTQRKSKYKLSYNRKENLKIFIDSGERYPWNFPAAEEIKESLPLGDYAIKDNYGILAVVERKTFNNFMAELGNLKKFHQHLSELGNCRHSALVIEANYDDFLKKEKIKPYTGFFAAKAIGEIQASHPRLPIIFAGSRKTAAVWTYNFFSNTQAKTRDKAGDYLKESAVKYRPSGSNLLAEDEIRRKIYEEMPERFTTSEMASQLPRCESQFVRNALNKLKKEGVIYSFRSGREIVWNKTSQ